MLALCHPELVCSAVHDRHCGGPVVVASSCCSSTPVGSTHALAMVHTSRYNGSNTCWRAWQQADGHTLCVCALLTHVLACRVLVAAASQTLGRDTFNTRIDSVEDKLQETRKELQETKEDLAKKLEAAQQGVGSRARTITDSMLPVRATA